VASVVQDGRRSTLLVAPAELRQGEAVVSLLGGPAGFVWLGLEWEDEARTVWEVMEAETFGPGRHVLIAVERTGSLRLRVRSDPGGSDLLRAVVQVKAATPPWQARLPWILSWCPLAAILLLREVARRGKA